VIALIQINGASRATPRLPGKRLARDPAAGHISERRQTTHRRFAEPLVVLLQLDNLMQMRHLDPTGGELTCQSRHRGLLAMDEKRCLLALTSSHRRLFPKQIDRPGAIDAPARQSAARGKARVKRRPRKPNGSPPRAKKSATAAR
jgi:hypothetical protein